MEKDTLTMILLALFILIVLASFPGKIIILFHNNALLIFSVLIFVLIVFLILLKNKK